MLNTSSLPVAIIGAGPIGLAAAAHLHARGEAFVLLEAGSTVGASLRQWAHVQVFSPWRYLIDDSARDLLASTKWSAPDPEGYPTGAEIVSAYLEPLAAVAPIHAGLRLNTRVSNVSRRGYDKLKSAGREVAPFAIQVESDGHECVILARAVIDASGTWFSPNPLGASGTPAPGERAARDRILYGIPDADGVDRGRYAGKHVLVVGSGHSAFNALLSLLNLVQDEPATRVTWAIRRAEAGQMFGGGADDQLSARAALGDRVRALLARGALSILTGFQIGRIDRANALEVVAEDGRVVMVDEIVAVTGFRPNLEMLRELRLNLDDRNEAPAALAPLIDPNLHSCGSVPPHGWAELKHEAEPGFYIAGMKSYGRAPTFLMLTGYEQVRSVVAAIAGDMEAALDTRLVLPETGVCSGPAGGCCEVDPVAGATAAQTEVCGCDAGCCATPSAKPGLISLASIPILFGSKPVAAAARCC
ncbi:MAG: NAD(P)-binding domain-containing protein [Thermoflexales bacterium]